MNDKNGKRIFSKQSYDENDKSAKDAIRDHLNCHGIYTMIHENFGADIHAYYPDLNRFVLHEVEMKNQWSGNWPDSWKEVRIPARKARLIKKNIDVVFWVLRTDRKQAWRIRQEVMTSDRIKNVSIRPCPSGEKFYCIPVNLCSKITLGR